MAKYISMAIVTAALLSACDGSAVSIVRDSPATIPESSETDSTDLKPTEPETTEPEPEPEPEPELVALTTDMLVGRYEVAGGNKDFQAGRFQYNGERGSRLRWIDDIGNSWTVDLFVASERLVKQPGDVDPSVLSYEFVRGTSAATGKDTNEIIGFNLDGVFFERISSDGGAYFSQDESMIGDTDLDAFVAANGGVEAWNEKSLFFLDHFNRAEELYYMGKYDLAQAVVDVVWDKYPAFAGSGWRAQTVPNSVQLGDPQTLTAMLMLTEALRYRHIYGAHEPTAKFTHLFIEAGCIEGIVPTTKAEWEANEGVMERRLISEDVNKQVYAKTFRLFGEFIEAMSNGAVEYEVDVVRLPEEFCLEGTVRGNFAGRIDAWSMLRAIDKRRLHESDMYTTTSPTFVPANEGDFTGKGWITGGMGAFNGRPVFIADDDAFLNKQPTNGDGPWTDIGRRVWFPHWINHEFFHAMFRTYFNEFQLETSSHQWFDRSKWPSDFLGNYEPDYFFQALERRFRDASPSVGARLQLGIPTPEDLETLTLEMFVGTYEYIRVSNDWHTADVTVTEDGKLKWFNRAGVTQIYELDKTLGVLTRNGSEVQVRFAYDDVTGAFIPGVVRGLTIGHNNYPKIR